MSKYFDLMPTINYNINGTTSNEYTTVANIFVRQKLTQLAREKAFIYYPYVIEDGERPDTLAHEYYGDVKYTWVIFFANDIVDPYFEWPLSTKEMNNFITKKYDSIAEAMSTIHSYNRILRETTSYKKEVLLEIDETTYDSLDPTLRKTVSKYEYEIEKNEAKRSIDLIDDSLVASVFNEVRKSLKNA